jgi:hypothetical protein
MNEPSNAERPVERPVGHKDGVDGSIAIPAEQVETLKEILAEWESGGRWMDREDCKNWKRSAIARENRRESIVLHNCASQIKAWIGRRNLRVLAHASRPDLTERDVTALESAASEIRHFYGYPIPHPRCDEGCMYHCTEGGTRPPKCNEPSNV